MFELKRIFSSRTWKCVIYFYKEIYIKHLVDWRGFNTVMRNFEFFSDPTIKKKKLQLFETSNLKKWCVTKFPFNLPMSPINSSMKSLHPWIWGIFHTLIAVSCKLKCGHYFCNIDNESFIMLSLSKLCELNLFTFSFWDYTENRPLKMYMIRLCD